MRRTERQTFTLTADQLSRREKQIKLSLSLCRQQHDDTAEVLNVNRQTTPVPGSRQAKGPLCASPEWLLLGEITSSRDSPGSSFRSVPGAVEDSTPVASLAGSAPRGWQHKKNTQILMKVSTLSQSHVVISFVGSSAKRFIEKCKDLGGFMGDDRCVNVSVCVWIIGAEWRNVMTVRQIPVYYPTLCNVSSTFMPSLSLC